MSFDGREDVRWITLDQVCSINTGKLNANAAIENGKYPFFTCDSVQSRIDTYAFDTEAILVSGNGSQIGHVHYWHGRFNAYQRTYVLHTFLNVSVKYLLAYMKAFAREYILLNAKKGSVPYITLPLLSNFKIPIPVSEEQERIAAILDKFDVLVNDISSGLPAEITARRQQYAYYRDKLLSFKETA